LRNIQLRMTYAFVTRARTKTYSRFLIRSVIPIFIQFSEVLRLEGISIPKGFEPRIALFEKHFAFKADILRGLLSFKAGEDRWRKQPDESWHEQLFPLVSAVVNWVQHHWHDR